MQPKVVEFDIAQLETNLDQIERALGEETSRPFRLLMGSYQALLQLIQEKDISVGRLRRLLFGARTERTRDVAGTKDSTPDSAAPLEHG